MTKEEIANMAEELFPIVGPDFGVTDTMHGHLNYGKAQFTAGAEWAVGEYDKFLEWAGNRRWVFFPGKGWQKIMPNKTIYISTSELYSYYKK